SDGEGVSAQGVMEWMNLLAAFPGMWGDYLAPLRGSQAVGLPDIVRAITVGGNPVPFPLAGPVNPTWFTDNELSQITPLPRSWDVYEPAHPHLPTTGPTSIRGNRGRYTGSVAAAGCYGTHWIGDGNNGPARTFVDPLGTKTVVTASGLAEAQRCVDAVYLMRSLSADAADYTTAGTPVAGAWRTSDGPWRLAAYHASTGAILMAPSPSPYRFSIGKAAALLSAHGWHVAPGKLATCLVAAKCGAGIPKGTPLAFSIIFTPSSHALLQSLATLR